MIPVTLPFIEPAAALARSWWKALVGAAVVAGPVFLMGQCSGASIERGRAEAARVEASAKATTTNAGAQVQAAGERTADTLKIEAAKKELSHAVEALPDAVPSDRRIALACARLRQQGTSVAGLPECAGLGGQAKARPRS